MTAAHDYLAEDGSGAYAGLRVRDLSGAAPRLVMVFESPHSDEVRVGTPLVGKAGTDALRFLTSAKSAATLGTYVRALHQMHDDRVSLINVSEMPLQARAIDAAARPLVQSEWDLLEKVRNRTARSVQTIRRTDVREASEVVLDSFRNRIATLSMTPSSTVVLAGKFAQRFWHSISPASATNTIEVPHPSLDQWNRARAAQHKGLQELKKLFREATT